MKFYCQQHDILNELIYAMNFTQSRNALSILSNVYLEVRNNTLLIRATDSMNGFQSTLDVESIEDGNCAILGERLLEIIRLLPDTRVLFETEDKNLTIRPDDDKIVFSSTLRIIDGSEFPPLAQPEKVPFFSIGQKPFISMSEQVLFSVSQDETRPVFCQVCMMKTDSGILMVSTDGRRLSVVDRRFTEDIPDFGTVLVPVKFFNELSKIAAGEGVVEIAIADNYIFANVSNHFFYTTLVKGEYPDFRTVVPKNQKFSCVVDRKKFQEAVKRVSVSIDKKKCKLFLTITQSGIELYSEENDFGISSEKIPVQYDSEDFKCSMNYTFLLPVLKAIESENVVLKFTDPARAITVYPDGEYDYFHLIMPMQSSY